ncbi:MAG TPA: hypothetical protein VHD56_13915 [Tepidisphaeraceae bacterium]|nr:hypothetical protein [Tepidisphaeraceae bacterium]
MRNLTSEPQARRSIGGYLGPLIFMVAAGAALGAAFFLFPIAPGREAGQHWCMVGLSMASLLVGLVMEYEVQNQLRLAREGKTADARIDEVHKQTTRNDCDWATYHFFTTDGQLIDGKNKIRMEDVAVLTQGSAVFVFYDPMNPKNNKLAQSMWAVTWG